MSVEHFYLSHEPGEGLAHELQRNTATSGEQKPLPIVLADRFRQEGKSGLREVFLDLQKRGSMPQNEFNRRISENMGGVLLGRVVASLHETLDTGVFDFPSFLAAYASDVTGTNCGPFKVQEEDNVVEKIPYKQLQEMRESAQKDPTFYNLLQFQPHLPKSLRELLSRSKYLDGISALRMMRKTADTYRKLAASVAENETDKQLYEERKRKWSGEHTIVTFINRDDFPEEIPDNPSQHPVKNVGEDDLSFLPETPDELLRFLTRMMPKNTSSDEQRPS